MSRSLSLPYLVYNSSVNDDIYDVMRLLYISKRTGPTFYTDTAEKLKLQYNYVELIHYILCTNNHGDYGTSPRALWLTPKGARLYKRLKRIKMVIKKEEAV